MRVRGSGEVRMEVSVFGLPTQLQTKHYYSVHTRERGGFDSPYLEVQSWPGSFGGEGASSQVAPFASKSTFTARSIKYLYRCTIRPVHSI